MIFILSAKDFIKNSKKLVEYKDYLIIDATDDDEPKLKQYQHAVTIDDFAVPSRLIRAISEDIDDFIDIDSTEELQKKFFRGEKFLKSVLATMSTFADSNGAINIFIVVRNKAYKYYRKRFYSEFCKLIPDAFSFAYLMDKKVMKDKSLLTKDISEKELVSLKKKIKEKEKELTELSERNKKKSKKKKHKKDGWGFKG